MKNKNSLLFVHYPSDLYGASRSLLRLTSRLHSEGKNVIVMLKSDGDLVAELKKRGIPVVINKFLSVIERSKFNVTGLLTILVSFPASVFSQLFTMSKYKVGIIHTNTGVVFDSAFCAFISRRVHIWHFREWFGEFEIFWKYYQYYINITTSRIICVSKPIAEQFKNQSKTVVINNGVPKTEFDVNRIVLRNETRIKYKLENKFVVGIVGRIKLGRKGQDVFVKAASILKERGYSEIKYLIVGSVFPGNENHQKELNLLIKKLNIEDEVVFAGEQADTNPFYCAMDVSVLASSLPEPFGGVVIESLALGVPVIGTAIGGTIEQIEHGINGYLFTPNSPLELVSYIEKMYNNNELLLSFKENSQRIFLQKFEFEMFYKKIVTLYDKLNKVQLSKYQ